MGWGGGEGGAVGKGLRDVQWWQGQMVFSGWHANVQCVGGDKSARCWEVVAELDSQEHRTRDGRQLAD